MKTEVCHIQLDRSERGAVIAGLEALREKRIRENKTYEVIDALRSRILNAPFRKTRGAYEAR